MAGNSIKKKAASCTGAALALYQKTNLVGDKFFQRYNI